MMDIQQLRWRLKTGFAKVVDVRQLCRGLEAGELDALVPVGLDWRPLSPTPN